MNTRGRGETRTHTPAIFSSLSHPLSLVRLFVLPPDLHLLRRRRRLSFAYRFSDGKQKVAKLRAILITPLLFPGTLNFLSFPSPSHSQIIPYVLVRSV